MQTILGAGGNIGRLLAKELRNYTKEIRLANRNPKKINDTDRLSPCDLSKEDQVSESVKGSEIVYLTVGLPYNVKTWQHTWPLVMGNVIEACKKHKSKLVFFDNNYMYDPNYLGHMTEETPINPISKKGQIRAEVVRMLMAEVEKGELRTLVARSADFYGPEMNQGSLLMEAVYKNLKNGKKANWLCSADYKHSHTYIPDAAKGTALLGNDEKAYQQVWHLPTAKKPLTGRQWINTFADSMGIEPKFLVVSKSMVRLLAIFSPIMREFIEMLYQYDRDYVFDSSKFEKYYHFEPTSYHDGIKAIVNQ